MLCQICYWFHWKQWNVRGRARRFSGNEANFGPNLHILISVPISNLHILIASPSQLDPFLNCQNEKLAKLKFKRCAYLYWYCSIYHSLTSLLVSDSVQKMLISTFCTFCSDHQSVPLVQDLNYDMILFLLLVTHTQRCNLWRSAGRTLMYQMQKCSFSVTYNRCHIQYVKNDIHICHMCHLWCWAKITLKTLGFILNCSLYQDAARGGPLTSTITTS